MRYLKNIEYGIMRTATRFLGSGALLTAVLLGMGPTAVTAEPSTFDVTVLAASCANCHGTDGRSPGAIPTIAGRPETILQRQLKAFQSDTPPAGTTVMNRLAKGLNDKQINALAHHFSQISQFETQAEVTKP